ncbi:hypothetical protein [Myxosarcina sp. GI1]|uniref:hypothetical protein n=1 Tax=Myxosarcina sp. GI1 TaxID=1541065 RepID=UPI00056C59C3|nr:hypothetical protein [Myxosarcina sp. GI1]
MRLSLLGKLSIYTAILAIPQLIVPTSDTASCWKAIAAEVTEYGEPGEQGVTGAKGKDGRNSDSLTVFADGSPMTLDLSGENGYPGGVGGKGTNAVCDEQPKDLNKDIRSSNGGNGGDGGNGGAGGNGGELTVYTTDKRNLQQIYVIATGGEGGSPGAGGEGGSGCQCDTNYWDRETCTGKPGSPDYNCTTSEFQCLDGYSGRKGREGIDGREGRLGKLTLINSEKSLAPDQPEAAIPINQLQERGVTLSKNIWETKTGATKLFAPGSILRDEYQELVARNEHTVLVVWDAPQPVGEFADEEVTLSLKGENDANVTLPDDLWLETTTLKQDKVTELFVFNAVKEKNVTRLTSKGVSGNGSNLQWEIVDKANQSDVLNTDFTIAYRVSPSSEEARFRRVYDYETKYSGEVPAEAIIREGDRFTLELGKLPVPPESLQPGVAIEVSLVANRSLGDRSKEQKMFIRDIIED